LKTNPFAGYVCDYSVVESMKSLRKVLIAQGAEAKVYFKDGTVLKERIVKEYRHAEIDKVIRKSSTRSEAKLLGKASELVPVPRVLEHCDREMLIKMEFVEGEKLRDLVEKFSVKERKDVFFRVGKKIAKLHNNDIIHGDLTTSNLIVKDKIYFIDFGLGFVSTKVEDKAVDLHLIERALDSKHYKHSEECFESILEGYASESKEFEKIMERFKKVALRGRYKRSKK
jgi:TP53 regulating kinase-like protein